MGEPDGRRGSLEASRRWVVTPRALSPFPEDKAEGEGAVLGAERGVAAGFPLVGLLCGGPCSVTPRVVAQAAWLRGSPQPGGFRRGG